MDLVSSTGTRGGVRGGRASFSWEAVKNDRHRENYLGHTLMAPTGRWAQKNDALWYAKERKNEDQIRREEKAALKAAEEEAIEQVLGIRKSGRDVNGFAEVLARQEERKVEKPRVSSSARETNSVLNSSRRSRSPRRREGRRYDRDDSSSPSPSRQGHSHSSRSYKERTREREASPSRRGYSSGSRDYRDRSRERDRRRRREDSSTPPQQSRHSKEPTRSRESDKVRDQDHGDSRARQHGHHGRDDRRDRDNGLRERHTSGNHSRDSHDNGEVDKFLDNLAENIHPSRRNLIG